MDVPALSVMTTAHPVVVVYIRVVAKPEAPVSFTQRGFTIVVFWVYDPAGIYTSPHPINAIAALVHAPISDSPHQVGRNDPRHATAAAICGETGSGSTPLPCGDTGPGGPLLVCSKTGVCSDTGPAVRRSLLDTGCRDIIPPGSCALNSDIIPRIAIAVHSSTLKFIKKAPRKNECESNRKVAVSS